MECFKSKKKKSIFKIHIGIFRLYLLKWILVGYVFQNCQFHLICLTYWLQFVHNITFIYFDIKKFYSDVNSLIPNIANLVNFFLPWSVLLEFFVCFLSIFLTCLNNLLLVSLIFSILCEISLISTLYRFFSFANFLFKLAMGA